MQIALVLLLSAFQLLTLIVSNPSLPQTVRENGIQIANQAVILAQQAIQTENAQSSSTPIVIPPFDFGSIVPPPNPVLITNPTPMNNEELVCTLTAESNVGAPSSFVNLTWTSNADSATLTNSRVGANYKINNDGAHPVTGATQAYQLSSESGEDNVFTAHFVLKGQTKSCSVTVMTQ